MTPCFRGTCSCEQAALDGLKYVHVSIPVGFSSSVQPNSKRNLRAVSRRFQSLSGFQVRCNAENDLAFKLLDPGFNPYRVFKFVATDRWEQPIPAPFRSFNPYRVFKFVATSGASRLGRLHFVSIPIGFSSSLQLPGGCWPSTIE